jgi:hypothetical protein
MTRPLPLAFLALVALLALPAGAHAAEQLRDDADDGVSDQFYGHQNDLRQVGVAVAGGQVTVRAVVEPGALTQGEDRVAFFFDTDEDGVAERAAVLARNGGMNGTPPAELRAQLVPVTGSATCQRVGAPVEQQVVAFPAAGPDGLTPLTFTFAAAHLPDPAAFTWSAYARTFSLTADTYDYAPDAANPKPGRPNPLPGVADGCDTNGDGVYGDETVDAGAYPVRPGDGFAFPDPGADDPPPPVLAPPPTPGPPGAPRAPVAPDPFAGWTAQSTLRTGLVMPTVTGRKVDVARERVLRYLGYADFDVVEGHPSRPPKGIGFGEVYAQTPAPRSTVTSGVATLPKVRLVVYTGPRPRGRDDCADRYAKLAKGLDADLGEDALRAAGCKVERDFRLAKTDDAAISRVTPGRGDRVTADVVVPSRPAEQDLFVTVRDNPNGLSFGARDWALTASGQDDNVFTVQVVDRAGRLVRGARVHVDATDVGAPRDPSPVPTNAAGETAVRVRAVDAGLLDLVVIAEGANDQALYGGTRIRVKDRGEKIGDTLDTTSGRTLRRVRDGWVDATASRSSVRARAAVVDFGRMLGWLQGLFAGQPKAAASLAGPGDAQAKVKAAAKTAGAFPAQLAVSGKPIGADPDLVKVTSGKVTLIGGAGANVIAAGGGNVISAGGLNLVVGAASGVISAGGLNVISAGSGNVVSAGSGNVVSAGGLNLIGGAGGNVISAGGGNVVSAGGLNLIAIGNQLVSDKGAGVVSAGGLN